MNTNICEHWCNSTVMGKFPATLEVLDSQGIEIIAIANHTMSNRYQVLPFVAVQSDDAGTMCVAPDKVCGAVRHTLQDVKPVPVTFKLRMVDEKTLRLWQNDTAKVQAQKSQLTIETYEYNKENQRRAVESFVRRLQRADSKRRLSAQHDMLTNAAPGQALLLKDGLGRVRGKLNWTDSGDTGHLNGFVIEEAWRGLGGGKKLLKEAENRSRRKGVDFMNLEMQSGSEEFYRRMGYGRGWSDGKILTRQDTFRVIPLQNATDSEGYAALRRGYRAKLADWAMNEYIPKEETGQPEIVLVLEDSGRAVGYASGGGDPFDSRFWRLNEVAVDPQKERLGGGRLLVGSMEEVAMRNGRRFILSIETKWKVNAFFKAMGYERLAVGRLLVKNLGLKRKTPDR